MFTTCSQLRTAAASSGLMRPRGPNTCTARGRRTTSRPGDPRGEHGETGTARNNGAQLATLATQRRPKAPNSLRRLRQAVASHTSNTKTLAPRRHRREEASYTSNTKTTKSNTAGGSRYLKQAEQTNTGGTETQSKASLSNSKRTSHRMTNRGQRENVGPR